MTDHRDPHDEPSAADRDAELVAGLLADPVVWTELDPALEDRVVDAIAAEVAASEQNATGVAGDHDAPVVALDDARSTRGRRWLASVAAGIAAAVVVIGGFAFLSRESGQVDVEVAMTATELAPDASAEVGIETTANGTRIVLDVSGLPPAPEGKVYEAWLRQDAEVGVSAGTFHMRGGPGELELWAGVDIADYPLVTVTIQDEGDTTSSGEVVLKALVES